MVKKYDKYSTTQLNSTQLNSTQLNSTQQSSYSNKFNRSLKKFIFLYIASILIVFIAIISLFLLGNMARKGYLSSFEIKSELEIENVYRCRVFYYSKIFKNSDFYGVYPYFETTSEEIMKLYFYDGEEGGPFVNLIINEELNYDDKIEILYKLKLKNNIFIWAFIFIIIFPLLYFYIVVKNYKSYILFFIVNISLYFLISFILPKFSILTFKSSFADIILSYIFLMTAYNFLNRKILLTLLFEAVNIFSFFIIEPIALTMQNTILLFSDMPILYPSLLQVLSIKMKIIVITATIIYFGSIVFLIILFIINLIRMKRKTAVVSLIYIFIFVYAVFFRKTELEIWKTDFIFFVNRNGIIDTINYKINYERMNKITYSKSELAEAVNILLEREKIRDYSNLLLNGKTDYKRDIFLIFLESFYDYSHFIDLFDKDPFSEEYRKWADNSRKIAPQTGGGSFYARLTGLTGSVPLYPKTQIEKIHYGLPDLLKSEGYFTIALEEAGNTYNLATFLPSIGFEKTIFGLGITNIKNYIHTNLNNLEKPIFLYGFTILGHTGSRLSNNLNIIDNNQNFINNFKGEDKINMTETLNNSAMTAMELIKIRDAILKYSPNALIIFKHDHLYPYLTPSIANSNIEDKYKNAFLNDLAPSPILIWDGTNGAYKVSNNFMPENIPMFIAINSGVKNYRGSMISLLYKEEIDDIICSYNNYYIITNDSLILAKDIQTNSKIFQYENSQRILSRDIFQGKKYYFDIIKDNIYKTEL